MLVWAVPETHADGRKAEVEKTVKDEMVVGLQSETMGVQAPTRVGPIAAALQFLIHPLARKRTVADASTESGRTGRPERDRSTYRSPMEAGITGGFSLLMDSPNARKRR